MASKPPCAGDVPVTPERTPIPMPAPSPARTGGPGAEDLVTRPGPRECNWLICPGYADLDPRVHHPDCPGHGAAGWRARVPERCVLDELDRIRAGTGEDTPIFRALAVKRAIDARYGEEIAS